MKKLWVRTEYDVDGYLLADGKDEDDKRIYITEDQEKFILEAFHNYETAQELISELIPKFNGQKNEKMRKKLKGYVTTPRKKINRNAKFYNKDTGKHTFGHIWGWNRLELFRDAKDLEKKNPHLKLDKEWLRRALFTIKS